MRPRIRTLALLVSLLLLAWSGIFASTYRYPFFWDDYHCIREYSAADLLSTFHGWDDPDQVETPAFRPGAASLFAFQGLSFGDNVVLQRAFLLVLSGLLLFSAGLLLAELEFDFWSIALVLGLFVSTRVFTAVNLWIILSTLIACYIGMVLALLFFVRWMKSGRWQYFAFMMLAAVLAHSIREEAYTLGGAVVILWAALPAFHAAWRRTLIAAISLLATTGLHAALRMIFVPQAPSPKITLESVEMFILSVKSAWMPGGFETVGAWDGFLAESWILALVILFGLFVRFGRPIKLWNAAGACCLGLLFCLPSLGVPRSFGLTMPSLAFFSALALAVGETYRQLAAAPVTRISFQKAFLGLLALVLLLGVTSGLRRANYVAESLHPNCASRLLLDANLVFDLSGKPTRVPGSRREAAQARFAQLGLANFEDLRRLSDNAGAHDPQYLQNRATRTFPFLPKYEYWSY